MDLGEDTESVDNTANEDIEEEEEDIAEEEETSYESVTYTCPIAENPSVIIASEYPVGVTITEEERLSVCRYSFGFENSSLVLGYELGETVPTDLGVAHVEISSEYIDSLYRVTTDGSVDYIYAVLTGENPCYQNATCVAESPYYGSDGQYLYSPGMITGGIAQVHIFEGDDREDVREVFDYIAGHTNMTRSE